MSHNRNANVPQIVGKNKNNSNTIIPSKEVTAHTHTAAEAVNQFQDIRNFKQDIEIEIDRYIGNSLLENKDAFKAITERKTVMVRSDTGTGKSRMQKDFARFLSKFLGIKVISTAPRNVIAYQQSINRSTYISQTKRKSRLAKQKLIKGKKESLHIDNNDLLFIGKTFEENTQKLLLEIDKYDILYCNNDFLEELTTLLSVRNIPLYYIADEIHLAGSDAGFRKEQIKSLFRVIENNHGLLLTATPKKLYIPTYNINIRAKNKAKYERPFVLVGNGKKAIQKAIELILTAKEENRNVILMLNSTKKIRAIEKTLLEHYKIKSYVFNSQDLTEEEEIIYSQTIKEQDTFYWKKENDINVILGTSVIANGVNINSDKDVDMIYFNNQNKGFDEIEYLQFIARVRNYESVKVNNFIITPSLNIHSEIESFEFKEWIDRAQRRCDYYNSEYSASNEYVKSTLKLESVNLLSFNEELLKFEVDKVAIQYEYEKWLFHYGTPLRFNPIEIEEIETIVSEQLDESIESITETQKVLESDITELYLNDFEVLCKSVHKVSQDTSIQSKCYSVFLLTDDSIKPIKLTSKQLSICENLLSKHFDLMDLADLETVQNALTRWNDKKGIFELRMSNYSKAKFNLRLDFLFGNKNLTKIEKDDIKLIVGRIDKLSKDGLEFIQNKDLLKKINRNVYTEKRLTLQKMNFYLERFFITEPKVIKEKRHIKITASSLEISTVKKI